MGAKVVLACEPKLAEFLQGQTSLRRDEFDCWRLLELIAPSSPSLDQKPALAVALPVTRRGGGGDRREGGGKPHNVKDAPLPPPPEVRARLHKLGLDLGSATTGAHRRARRLDRLTPTSDSGPSERPDSPQRELGLVRRSERSNPCYCTFSMTDPRRRPSNSTGGS